MHRLLPQFNFHKPFAIAAIGLAIIQGAAFALTSPNNNLPDTIDHWFYPYLGDRIWREFDIFYSFSGRQFSTWGLALTQGFFPGNFAAIFYLHVFSVWVFSLTIYSIISRLFPSHRMFAFLTAAVYLVYVPYNSQHILYWLQLYSWTLMIGGFAVLALLEYSYRSSSIWRWLWLGGACVLAYLTARGYETSVPLIALAPLLQWFPHRRVNRSVIIGAGLWWVSTAIGFLQFMIPYLRGDPTLTYHRSVEDSGEGGILVLIENTFRFAGNSFPLMMIVRDFEIATIIFPAIAASAVLGVVILFRTLLPAASDPFSFRQLGLVILVGFAMNMAGGAGYIFGNFIDVPRSQVFAAPGQAVVIVGILGLIALGVQRVTSVSYWMALSVALVVLFFTAGQWFYAHDALYGANSITRQRAPYRELIALVPSVEDDTLLLNFQCVTHPREDLYHSELINGFATRYLYDYTGGSHIQMAVLEYVTFDETGVTFADRIVTDPTEPRHYTYDQMVIVACSDDHLVIVNQFPSTFAPPNAYINAYDPRSRLSKPRISDSKLAILALSTVP